jgi:DNA-directed RNA polymerase subunit RPC12/RpoP
MKLITLRTFDNSPEAHIAQSKLESEGIYCFLFDENMVTLNPLYNITVGGIKLKINEDDLTKAQEILNSVENTPLTNEAGEVIKCPKCGSTNLFIGFKSMKGLKGITSFLISILFMIFPLFYKSVYSCKNCGTEFK